MTLGRKAVVWIWKDIQMIRAVCSCLPRQDVSILGSCLIMPVAVTLLQLSQGSVCLKASVPVRHYKVNKLLYVYMVLGWICPALGAVCGAVKSLSVMHSKGRHSFTLLNESDFGFQTVSSSCTAARLRTQEEIVTSINTGIPWWRVADCATRTDSIINKWLASFCLDKPFT